MYIRLQGKDVVQDILSVCWEKWCIPALSCKMTIMALGTRHSNAERQTESSHDVSVTPLSQPTWRFAPELWGNFARKFAYCCSHSSQASPLLSLFPTFPPSLYPLSSESAWWTSISHSLIKHTKMLLTLYNKMTKQSHNSLTLSSLCDFLSLSFSLSAILSLSRSLTLSWYAEWGDFAYQMLSL